MPDFTFGPTSEGGQSYADSELFEFQRLMSQFQRFNLEQQGFTEQTRTVGLEEGLSLAPAGLRTTYEQTQDRMEHLRKALMGQGMSEDLLLSDLTDDSRAKELMAGGWTPTGRRDFVPEWLAELKKLQGENKEIVGQITNVSDFAKSPELLEQEQLQKESLGLQRELSNTLLKRQIAAQKGELPLSEVRQRERQDAFEAFKEAQLRAGRQILGDTPENAIAKGTAAEGALESFKNQLSKSRLDERQGIEAQAPFAFQAAGLGSSLGRQQFSPIALPTQPSMAGFGALQAGLQPFQFNQNIAAQLAMANMQNNQGQQSGLTGAQGALSGAAAGASLGPWGMLGGAALGYGVTQF